MSHHTAKNWKFGDAPARVTLKGDKTKKTEPAQHIIEFPGGAIEVSRLADGDYWVHVIVNRAHAGPDWEGSLLGAFGRVVDSRVDWEGRQLEPIREVSHADKLTQVAVRIRPTKPAGGGE